MPLAIVTAIIVASSIVAMASPFLLRHVIDVALPQQNVPLLIWLVLGMIAVAAVRPTPRMPPTASARIGLPLLCRTSGNGGLSRVVIRFLGATPIRS